MKKLYYFGTIKEAGHYWFGCNSFNGPDIVGLPNDFFRRIDGMFCPPYSAKDGIYRFSHIGALQIVSWNDRSVDHRPGSNSNLFGVGFIDGEEMITEAYKQFPEVMNRQARPEPEFI